MRPNCKGCAIPALLLCLGLALGASAQGKPASKSAAKRMQSAPGDPAQTTTTAEEPAQKAPVKAYTLPRERYEKAVAYSRARYRHYFLDSAYSLVVLLLILAWRLGPKYRDWAGRVSPRRFVQTLIFTPLLLLTMGVLGLPSDIYGHWLSRKYELSVQGWGSWAWDWTKGELLGFVIGIVLVWILYGVIRRSPRRWWFYFWLASLPILAFLFFISPYIVQPLFFKFEPLAKTQPALVAEIERVVQRAGMDIPPERVFEMKASEKLNALNAYVTGFGASKRVVMWDTTMQKMTVAETLFVFGHEMGHYVLQHIPKEFVLDALVLLLFLYLGYRGMHWTLEHWGGRWAIRGVDDWASLPVLLLFFAALSFVGSPAFNAISRHYEHQADIYGLEVIHGIVPNSAQVAAESFQVLGEVDLSDPNPSPFIEFWLYGHPSIGERVQFALHYDPWGKGESPQFVK